MPLQTTSNGSAKLCAEFFRLGTKQQLRREVVKVNGLGATSISLGAPRRDFERVNRPLLAEGTIRQIFLQ
jgi:hypothetical protein